MRVEWHDRMEFAEVAEALDTTTDRIMAVNWIGTNATVFYTPGDPNEMPPKIWMAILVRDPDNVLICPVPPVERVGMWESITKKLNKLID
jgi:hypothetical protein